MKPLLYCMVLSLPMLTVWAGCGGGEASTVHLNDGVTPGEPVFYGNVKVFTTRALGREVEELGSVCISTRSELSPEAYLTMIKKEAASVGADAIIGYEIMDGTATGVAVRYKMQTGQSR
jgi:uncharacterized protein YbjQ (UPF0145 family)